MLMAAAGQAQIAPDALPGAADPGRLDVRPPPPEPQLGAPPPTPSPPSVQDIPEGAERIRIRLERIDAEGAAHIPPDALTATVAPFLGADVPLSNLYHAAAAVTAWYHREGYILSRATVPPQELNGGRAVLKVTEGYVASVRTEGPYASTAVVESILAKIGRLRPFNVRALERHILLLNDMPGLKAQAIIEPLPDAAAHAEGAVGIVIVFSKTRFRNSASVDNFGSRYLGPYQGAVRLGANGLTLPYSQTMFYGLSTVPTDELKYGAVSHTLPVLTEGLMLHASGSYSRSSPGHILRAIEIESDATNLTAGLNYMVIRSRQQNFQVGFELNAKDIDTDILGTTNLYEDRLRVLRASAIYDNAYWLGGANLFSATASFGLDGFGASEAGSLNLSRAEGHSDFTKLELTAARLQPVVQHWSIYAALAGQVADKPLLSSEEFGYGGQVFGRAYDASELTGDHGVAGSVELRYGGLPEWGGLHSQLFGFYDFGKVWNRDSTAGDAAAASAGAGIRVNYGEDLSASFSVAQPLTRDIQTPLYGDKKNPRLLFTVNYRF